MSWPELAIVIRDICGLGSGKGTCLTYAVSINKHGSKLG